MIPLPKEENPENVSIVPGVWDGSAYEPEEEEDENEEDDEQEEFHNG